MLKVLYVVTTVEGYGADKSIINNILYLKRNKLVDPYVVIPHSGRIEEIFVKNDIPYTIKNHKSWFCGSKKFVNKEVKRWIKSTYNKMQAVILAKKLKQFGIFDFIHTNTMTTSFGIYLAQMMGAKHVMHIRELPVEQFGWTYEYGEEETLHFIRDSSSVIIANSEYVAQKFKVFVDDISVIYNGVFDGVLIDNPNKYDFSRGLIMLCAGRLEHDKGQVVAIKAMGVLKKLGYRDSDICLDIYGDGSLSNKYNEYINQEGLDSLIKMIPFDENLGDKMSGYNIGLICSLNEAFGRTAIEFMGNGLAVIGNDTGNTPVLIENGDNGLIVNYGSAEDLAEKIAAFIADKRLVEKYGNKGFQSVQKKFSIEDSSHQLMAIYNGAL
jgi:L-malate glycosyltransferase